MTSENIPENCETKRSTAICRSFLAVIVGILVSGYTVAVTTGYIKECDRIDAVHLVLIALTVVFIVILLQPEVVSRLRVLEMTGFKLELLESVEKVKEKQARQGNILSDINMILPLLLPETERVHLLNLDMRNTNAYKGSGSLRAELRRLRSIGLIKMRFAKPVGSIKDGLIFDLADYVELTRHGERWVQKIRDIEKVDSIGEQ